MHFSFFSAGNFRIAEEDSDFRLSVGEPSGSAGDILGLFNSGTPLDNAPFSTADRYPPSARQMLGLYRYGWWYPLSQQQGRVGSAKRGDVIGAPSTSSSMTSSSCFTHLNHAQPWYCSKEGKVMLAYVTMKIRPK